MKCRRHFFTMHSCAAQPRAGEICRYVSSRRKMNFLYSILDLGADNSSGFAL